MIKINGTKVDIKQFPNGETLLDGNQILEFSYGNNSTNTIAMHYETDQDLMNLMFVEKHLRNNGMVSSILEIMYMPYSRMDRSENRSVFTLKYVSEFINQIGFKEVNVLEPHSDVTTALIDNVRVSGTSKDIFDIVISQSEFNFNIDCDYIYFPDAGASKKYSKMFKGYNILIGHKQRDFDSGKILSLDIFGDTELKGRRVIIVDDLCSRGGTFVMSAEKLKQMGAKEVVLIVTHCENSIMQGMIPSSNLIDKVYCTNSMLNDNNGFEKIKIIKL